MINRFVQISTSIILLTLASFSHSQSSSKDSQNDSIGSENSNRTDQSTASASSLLDFIPSMFSAASYSYKEEEEDYLHDIDELEALLGGPLENRKFVTVDKTSHAGGGKSRESSYKFRTNARLKRDSVKELKEDKNTRPSSLNQTMLEELLKAPEGFNSSTIYYHHTIKLTALERIQETNATLGSDCETKSLLDHDFCERSPYPNKNKMVCNKALKMGKIEQNKCICKFYRKSESKLEWRQMRTGKIKLITGQEVDTCLVPAYGVCDHRLPTGIKDLHNHNVFEVDVCKGHYQCDNSKYLNKLVDTKNGQILQVKNHCTEEDFLKMFDKKVRHEILLCSKPHPRRFNVYDEYKYYCLPMKSRDPEQWQFQKPPSEEEEKERDLFFDD